MKTVTVTAPGNLLLFGEYAVTLPGGLGVACGIQPKVVATVEPAPRFSILGTGGPSQYEWPEDTPSPLLQACVESALSSAGKQKEQLTSQGQIIRIDSSAFFRRDGSKRGLGSSAAVAVAATTTLLLLLGDEEPPRDAIFSAALHAHRQSQSGRGSGYDVAASVYGGLGLFVGGVHPSWSPLSEAWLPRLFLIQGKTAVSTAPAIDRFNSWRQAEPGAAEELDSASKAAITTLTRLDTWDDAAPIVEQLAAIGRNLGTRIGVPADPPAMSTGDGGDGTCPAPKKRSSLQPRTAIIKAVGAGAELFVCFGRSCVKEDDDKAVRLSEGVVWHT